MPGWLRQSTAVTIQLGEIVDKGDGVTGKTTFTGTLKLSKMGGAFAVRNGTPATPAADAGNPGWFTASLDATDTNTVGLLKVSARDPTVYFPVGDTFQVLPQAVYDALVVGTPALAVELTAAARTNLMAALAVLDEATIVSTAVALGLLESPEVAGRSHLLNVIRYLNNGVAVDESLARVRRKDGSEAYALVLTPAPVGTPPVQSAIRSGA